MADPKIEKIIEKHLKDLKKWCEIEKCKTCDCFQGALTQFELDGPDEIKEKTKDMIIGRDGMHGCLGCDPCPPAEIFCSYIRAKKRLDEERED